MAEFDALGDTYERSAVELPFREHLEHHSIRQAVGDVAGLRVLDLGCGSGLYTRRLAAWGATRVLGIDVSEGMLDTARAHPRTPPPVSYRQHDATHPGPDGDPELADRFDLVFSVYVLCYATTHDELAGFFTTAHRALAPGGRLIAMTLNPGYGRGRDYYAGYGFTLTQPEDREGAPVTLHAQLPSGDAFDVTARWWSSHAYQHAATTAGFAHLSWTHPTVSADGIERHGSDYWAAYLAAPQAVILHAVKSDPVRHD
ncbi:class I SAM-dependent methyltransferase [Amycolatopsis minnesotensis]|uniref:Methyltransferase domain-containing protein n=1 Tax=Amycolatopsis minnesotensis TaxID=337894 RepID=A0ABN2SKH9_9PSEU